MSAATPLATAIDDACRRIAPQWPLDRQIAVNPFWGFTDQGFEATSQMLRRLLGSRLALPRAEYRRAWSEGKITRNALLRALEEHGARLTVEQALAALQEAEAPAHGISLLSEVLDEHAAAIGGPRWRDIITQQLSQYCASYFDEHQADWHRDRRAGLFGGWRRSLQVDHALEPLMHAPQIRARAREMPEDPVSAIEWSLQRLQVPPHQATEWLLACLLRIHGWASWCAYLGWEARLAGSTDAKLRELLAMRVAWEALLASGSDDQDPLLARWRGAWEHTLHSGADAADECDGIWQRAHEIAYQDELIRLLNGAPAPSCRDGDATGRFAQIVCCIDVRSERLRRALETLDPGLSTHGFAGFFGLPVRYTSLATSLSRPQLPGLIAPSLQASSSSGVAALDAVIAKRRTARLQDDAAFHTFARSPSGAFALVETLGLAHAGSMLRRHAGAYSPPPLDTLGLANDDLGLLKPCLSQANGVDADRKAAVLAAILRGMSLTAGFARLFVLVGHGSQSANNPHGASLDCGACGGQTGEVNARLLCSLFNDAAVRRALGSYDIHVPKDSWALAALHNTTTDEVHLFDTEALPASHAPDLQRLQRVLVEAGQRTRAERAPDLGLAGIAQRPVELLKCLRRRAGDWAQTRPEWGLAGNAAFIVAPRARTRGLDLQGRTFLHDYAWQEDRDGKVLESIMTAPMVVTHWINLQYFASTTDPERFGSGNKVLHNVACGRVGVFEGNSGDLRVGLSRQSVHDGHRWMHAPLRLSVFIDAPREMIERVLSAHPTVRQLVDHRWLYLFRFQADGVAWYSQGRWTNWTEQPFLASHRRAEEPALTG